MVLFCISQKANMKATEQGNLLHRTFWPMSHSQPAPFSSHFFEHFSQCSQPCFRNGGKTVEKLSQPWCWDFHEARNRKWTWGQSTLDTAWRPNAFDSLVLNSKYSRQLNHETVMRWKKESSVLWTFHSLNFTSDSSQSEPIIGFLFRLLCHLVDEQILRKDQLRMFHKLRQTNNHILGTCKCWASYVGCFQCDSCTRTVEVLNLEWLI